MMRCCSGQIPDTSRNSKLASINSNDDLNGALSNPIETLMSSQIALLVSLSLTSEALWQMRMWLAYTSTITLWIFLLQALGPICSIQPAVQPKVCYCQDGIQWLDYWWRICIGGGCFSSTLEGGRMGENWEFFGQVVGLFLVFCELYWYIIQIHAWSAILSVCNVAIVCWDVSFEDWHCESNRTLCMGIT